MLIITYEAGRIIPVANENRYRAARGLPEIRKMAAEVEALFACWEEPDRYGLMVLKGEGAVKAHRHINDYSWSAVPCESIEAAGRLSQLLNAADQPEHRDPAAQGVPTRSLRLQRW